VVTGYLGVGAVAALCASTGTLRPSWVWTAVCLPGVALVSAGAGVWTAYGWPYGGLRAFTGERWERLWVAVRAALGAVAVLVGGGGLLVGVSLAWHGRAAQASFLQLSAGWPGRCAVLLLAVALVPNAAVWGAAYALGPGFLLAAGHAVGPLATAPPPALLPPFPLLAAVPRGTAGHVGWALGILPVAAGVVAGWLVARDACRSAWSAGRTAGVVSGAGVVCGVLLGWLAEASGGPLGVAALARFGPVGWQVGGAAVGWTVAVGLPVAVGTRWWRLRRVGERRVEAPSAVAATPVRAPAVPLYAEGEADAYEVLAAEADPFLAELPKGSPPEQP
jgi:hypothetical protein